MTLIRSDFALEADARQLGHDDVPVLDAHAVREAAIGLEQVGIALVAAEAEAGRDVERHLVSAMRDAAARRPAELLEHIERAQVFDEAVGQRAIELQPIAVGPHAAVAQEVAGVLVREQVLARRHGAGVELGQGRLQRVVEGIADLLVPEQRVVAQHLGIGDGGLEVEAPVGVDRELRLRADLGEHRLDAAPVLGEGCAADLHLDDVVAAVEIAAHLGPQRRVVLARIVVAAGRVDEDARVGLAAVALGQEAEERLAGDLGRRVPHRHVERPDRHRALAVAARLLVRSSWRPRSCAGRGCRRSRRARLSGAASRMRSRKRSRMRPPWP